MGVWKERVAAGDPMSGSFDGPSKTTKEDAFVAKESLERSTITPTAKLLDVLYKLDRKVELSKPAPRLQFDDSSPTL